MLFTKKKDAKPEIFTEETCSKCGDISRREFIDGDYVFKRVENVCSKCSSSEVMVTGVYGEYPPEKDQSIAS